MIHGCSNRAEIVQAVQISQMPSKINYISGTSVGSGEKTLEKGEWHLFCTLDVIMRRALVANDSLFIFVLQPFVWRVCVRPRMG